MTEDERFWVKVNRTDACWLWTAARSAGGYGYFKAASGKQVYAHRWAYEHLVGPIPSGLTVDHLCRVRDCVNPAHLEAVTGHVNMLRGYSPPAQHARRDKCSEGHPLIQGKLQRYCPECRRKYVREYSARLRREAGIPEGRGAKWAAKTHCPHGHPYDEANTMKKAGGGRICRTCQKAAGRKWRERKRQAGQ